LSSPRILFYCHNLFGLGHIRRSTRLASACADLGATCRVVTGCRRLDAIEWDERIGLDRLPALEMGPDQQLHEAGHPERTDIMQKRSEFILESCRSFSPEIFVIDYLPAGLGGELLPLGGDDSPLPASTRVVWGVPYTKRISRPTSKPRNPRIRRWMDRFDAVLAYTDPSWEDPLPPLEPGGLPELKGYTGFITGQPALTDSTSREVVILAGGGREAIDMAPLIKESLGDLVAEGKITIRCVVGPLGDSEKIASVLGSIASVVPAESVEEAVRSAAVVVSRCGYNSSYTLMRSEAPIIFLPQISPCFEQLDRAAGLKTIDRVRVLREDSGDAAEHLKKAVLESLGEPHSLRDLPFAVDGDVAAAKWLLNLYESSR